MRTRKRKDFATFASIDVPSRSLLESSRAKGHSDAKNGKGKNEAELGRRSRNANRIYQTKWKTNARRTCPME